MKAKVTYQKVFNLLMTTLIATGWHKQNEKKEVSINGEKSLRLIRRFNNNNKSSFAKRVEEKSRYNNRIHQEHQGILAFRTIFRSLILKNIETVWRYNPHQNHNSNLILIYSKRKIPSLKRKNLIKHFKNY
jgi:hypothetical protein